jgi:hypothetical protein
MALPTPAYPGATFGGNEQSTTNDGPPNDTLAQGLDYNKLAAELVAVEDDIRAAFASESAANLLQALQALRTSITSFDTHATQHKHGGGDEVATAAPGPNLIPKSGAGSTLSTGWLPQATEAAKGTAEIATQTETDAETDDSRIVTPLKLGTWLAGKNFLEEAGAVDESQSTTTSSSWQDKLSFTTDVLTGTYRIAWMAVIGITSTSNAVEARLYNVTDAVAVHTASYYTPGSTTDFVMQSGWCDIVFSGATKQFKIQFRRIGVAGTASIENTRIAVRKKGV